MGYGWRCAGGKWLGCVFQIASVGQRARFPALLARWSRGLLSADAKDSTSTTLQDPERID